MAVGAPTGFSGFVYLYHKIAGEWIEEQMLFPFDAAPGDRFGTSVTIDHGTLVIGASRDDPACPIDEDCDSGSAYVYERLGLTWTLSTKLIPEDTTEAAEFGHAVVLNGDIAVIGAPFGGSGGGRAYAYHLARHEFQRGDCNGDGSHGLVDAIAVLESAFMGATVPCLDACDIDDDGDRDLADAVLLLLSLFGDGPPPAPPTSDCGVDPTQDGLSCLPVEACP